MQVAKVKNAGTRHAAIDYESWTNEMQYTYLMLLILLGIPVRQMDKLVRQMDKLVRQLSIPILLRNVFN